MIFFSMPQRIPVGMALAVQTFRSSHRLDRHRAARERDRARARDLDDAVLLKHLAERVDLALAARKLNDNILRRHVDDVRAEDVDDIDDVGARRF